MLLNFFYYIYTVKKKNKKKIITMAYEHTNSKGRVYHCNSKDVTLKSTGRVQTIYYFSKDARDTACDLPAGKMVIENAKTGLPMLKNK